jgi:hypothetical protein
MLNTLPAFLLLPPLIAVPLHAQAIKGADRTKWRSLGSGAPLQVRRTKEQDTAARIAEALRGRGLSVSAEEAEAIRARAQAAMDEAHAQGAGGDITDPQVIERIAILAAELAVRLSEKFPAWRLDPPTRARRTFWESHFEDTIDLGNNRRFVDMLDGLGFSPLDPRTSEGVGAWVRKQGRDPHSARRAFSVCRKGASVDAPLTAPAEKIIIHGHHVGVAKEKTLAARLRELGLYDRARDRKVLVSNQFVLLPVPGDHVFRLDQRSDPRHPLTDGTRLGPVAPRLKTSEPSHATFNLSTSPLGPASYVIADSDGCGGEAVVVGDLESLLFADSNGQRAPFAARSGAQVHDEVQLGQSQRPWGEDIAARRFCVIQVPLRAGAKDLVPGSVGAPPNVAQRAPWTAPVITFPPSLAPRPHPLPSPMPMPRPRTLPAPITEKRTSPDERSRQRIAEQEVQETQQGWPSRAQFFAESLPADTPVGAPIAGKAEPAPTPWPVPEPGALRLIIAPGEAEGAYSPGTGFKGNRAPEHIRATFVYVLAVPQGTLQEHGIAAMANLIAALDSGTAWNQ